MRYKTRDQDLRIGGHQYAAFTEYEVDEEDADPWEQAVTKGLADLIETAPPAERYESEPEPPAEPSELEPPAEEEAPPADLPRYSRRRSRKG